tara:strand:+ start:2748 stop:2993 length:246 start_codon:yes stop_codon:yes gene_type:complete
MGKTMTPETYTGVLLPSSIIKLKETNMAKKLYGSLVSMFGRKKLRDNDILTWARTEYGKDWNFAYEHIKATGKGPRMGVHN